MGSVFKKAYSHTYNLKQKQEWLRGCEHCRVQEEAELKSQKNLNSTTNEPPCDLVWDTRGFIFSFFILGERGPSFLLCKAAEGIKIDRGKTSL